jgi:hypothetical protein
MALIRPSFLDEMSWEMAEVYGAVNDQILVNLARYFPYWTSSTVPKSAFEYQAAMLAQMGQVNRDTIKIIRKNLKDADDALQNVLEQAIMEAVSKSEPSLLDAVKKGILHPAKIPTVAPNQYRAFQLYYQQAADKLNLVNTVMLESTKQAYQATVSDIAARVQATQTALDIGTGEVVTGVSSWNSAMVHSINRLKQNGITGFIDHGGHRWSAEAYTAMDIRTTVANTARAAVWEVNQDFGNDLYMVSYHDGARPLCYPYQNRVISASNKFGVTYDLDGNEIPYIAQSATTYGQPAGLFGINCKHYPTPFIPGVSIIRGEPQSPEENEKTYAESQKQRALERKIREEKRDLAMLKAQGAPDDIIKAQRAKIRQTDDDIDAFCAETGRARRQNREGAYTYRSFPDPDTYDVTEFERTQKDRIEEYFKTGGVQNGYSFGALTPNTPGMITPTPEMPVVNNAPVPETPQRIGIDTQTLGQYPYKPSELPSTPGSLNVYGEEISFSEKFMDEKRSEQRDMIINLASEFKSRLREVSTGKSFMGKIGEAGSVDSVTGTMMKLSSKGVPSAIHEFSHTITTTEATKYGFADDNEFWKEIRSVRTQYRKAIRTDSKMMISLYADVNQDINEFMAEGFALGYMREHGIAIPDDYGNDTIFSAKVLEIVRKYFSK